MDLTEHPFDLRQQIESGCLEEWKSFLRHASKRRDRYEPELHSTVSSGVVSHNDFPAS